VYPPIFQIVAADATATGLLGSNPVRFWPFGSAPQDETRPYATHQLVSGAPVNTITTPPRADRASVQVDAYGKTATEAWTVANAIAGAIETSLAYVASWDLALIDADTGLFRVAFTCDFYVPRAH
jgi:hypothetical protein